MRLLFVRRGDFRKPLCRERSGGSRSRVLRLEPLEERALLDAVGPRILSISPTEIRNAAFDHVDVEFSEPIDPATFTIDDVSIVGADGPMAASTVAPVSGNMYRVSFPAFGTRGSYQATIGPNIADLDGNLMDQNQDGTKGNPTTDVYKASLLYIEADTVFTSTITIAEGDTTYEGQDILVDGATVAIDGPHNFGSVHLIRGAVLTHSACTTTATHKLDLTVSEQVIVDASSRIDVTARGYRPGYTTGNTNVGGAWNSGASYGGWGGGSSTNRVYGAYANVDEWGSGSADGWGGGGAGGGLARIAAAALILDGQILSNGQNTDYTGGAGGGVHVAVTTLQGSGNIRAAGAPGRQRGAGGGGRVAVYAEDFSGFNLTNIAAPGGANSSPNGGAGTVYVRDTNESSGTLIIDSGAGGIGSTPLGLAEDSTLAIPDAVVIRGAGAHVRPEHEGLVVYFQDTVTVETGSSLQLPGGQSFENAVTISGSAHVEVQGGLRLEPTSELTLSSNAQLEVQDSVRLESTSALTLTSNGWLVIQGGLHLEPTSALTLTSGGRLEVQGELTSAIPLTVNGGAVLSIGETYNPQVAVTVSGGGRFEINGSMTTSQPLTLTSAGALQVSGTVSTLNPLVVDGAGIRAGRIEAPDLSVLNGATLTSLTSTATQMHKLELEIAGTLLVDSTSRIDVSEKGYLRGRTTGNTTVGGATGNSGGSFGGLGGVHSGSTNVVYGSYTNPNDWGSGGDQGAGGGLVRISAGVLDLDGQVLANGQRGGDSNGSGSGGGIYVVADTLTGSGSIRASGGYSGWGNGPGGGGRIAVYAGDFSDFDLNKITAPAGPQGNRAAGAGTVYVKDTDDSTGTLIVNGSAGGGGWTPLGLPGDVTFAIPDEVVIRGSGSLVRAEHAGLVLEFQNTLVVQSGGFVQLPDGQSFENAVAVSGSGHVQVQGGLLLEPTSELTLTSSGWLEVQAGLTSAIPLTVTGGAKLSIGETYDPQVAVTASGGGRIEINGSMTTAQPLTLTSGAALQVFGALNTANPLVVDGAAILAGRIEAPDLSVLNGATLTSLTSTATQMHKLELEIAGTLLVDSTSRIDVSEKGYLRGRTTGNTTVGGATGNSGGSFGGLGGVHSGSTNVVYGSYTNPNDWGSGGDQGAGGGLVRISAGVLDLDGQVLANGQRGGDSNGSGSGGGIYVVADTLTGSGSIRASGGYSGWGNGPGGGGRIAVYAGDFSDFDLNKITAPAGPQGNRAAGAGTVYVKDTDDSTGTLIVNGSAGGGGWTPLGLPGDVTFAIPDEVVIRGSGSLVRAEHAGLVLEFQNTLVVQSGGFVQLPDGQSFENAVAVSGSGHVQVQGGLLLEPTSELTLTSSGWLEVQAGLTSAIPLTVTGGAKLSIGETYDPQVAVTASGGGRIEINGSMTTAQPLTLTSGAALQVFGALNTANPLVVDGAAILAGRIEAPDLSVLNGATLTSLTSTATQMHKLELEIAGTLLVDSTSRIDVSEKGYLRGRTTGNTTVGGATGNSGGSFGGLGGVHSGSTNVVYGSYTNPNDWGSGGDQGAGGGLVRISAGVLDLDGQVLANGQRGGDSNGSGSGGGIYVVADTLTGSGSIRASGGYSGWGNGPGGGGRIAVYAGDFSDFDLNKITAPAGPQGNRAAGAGTVYVKDTDDSTGTLIVNGSAGGGGWTPLGLPGDVTFAIPDEVVIRGSGSLVRAEHAGLVLEFQNTLVVQSGGFVQLPDGQSFENAVAVSGSGHVQVQGGLLLEPTSELTLTSSGWLEVQAGLTSAIPLTVTGGAKLSIGETYDPQVAVTASGGGRIEINGSMTTAQPLTLTSGAALQVFGALNTANPLVVDGAAILAGRIEAPDLSVLNGATLTSLTSTATQMHKLELEIAGTLLVDSTSRIDVSEKGYLRGRTTGNTTVGGATGNSGGSFGGLGGVHSGSTNVVYGSYTNPNDWGSGGDQGAGGGLVRISAGVLDLDGQVLANGQRGGDSNGSGSGGGIYVVADTLTGSGSIRASGGYSGWGNGPGGGGRIAVYAGDFSDFDLNKITAPAGPQGNRAAGAGTVYVKDTDDSTGTLIVNGSAGGGGWTPLGLPGDVTFAIPDEVVIRGSGSLVRAEHAGLVLEFQNTLVVQSGGFVQLPDGQSFENAVAVSGSGHVQVQGGLLLEPTSELTLTSSGWLEVQAGLTSAIPLTVGNAGTLQVFDTLTAAHSTIVDGGVIAAGTIEAPDLSVLHGGVVTSLTSTAAEMHGLALKITGTLLVDATSRIDVNGKGYVAGRTAANTSIGGATGHSGGSYGGSGGIKSGATNRIYGDYADPQDWGSGGSGGPGGGLVRVEAATFLLNGQLLADGATAANAGSGGGIFVAVASLDGGGAIRAAGGRTTQYAECSGGGGRVAVYAEDFGGFDVAAITAPGGAGSQYPGAPGTVHIVQGRPHTHVWAHGPLGPNGPYLQTMDHVQLDFNNPILLDTFELSDLSIRGPLGPIPATCISQAGDRRYRIDFDAQTENGNYHFNLAPTIFDDEGFLLDQNANGIPGEPEDVYSFTLVLDTVAPRVTNHAPAGDVTGTISFVDVWFSETMDRATFATADVAMAGPSGQAIAATSVQEVGLNRFRITFAPQTAVGVYHVRIGPDVRDLAGNKLDQDGDGHFGDPEDIYDAKFNYVPVDLVVSNVTVDPAALWAGEPLSVSWQGRNASGAPLLGNWTDGVYLSTDAQWDIGDIRIATVDHTGGLAQNEVYTASANACVPGALPGQYYVIVRADVYNQEKELGDQGNNISAAGPLSLDVRELGADGIAVGGTLSSSDRWDYYKLNLGEGQTLRLNLDGDRASARPELYVSYAAIPTRMAFDERSALPAAQQQIALTGISSGGTYYVAVYGGAAASGIGYSLFAEEAPFFISDITPRRHGTAAGTTVTITGEGFDQNTAAEFFLASDTFHRALPVEFVSPSTLKAYLDVPELRAGIYSVRVSKGGTIAELLDVFTIVPDGVAELQTNLVVPSGVSPGFPTKQTLWIEYRNVGDIAMPAPLLQVVADANGLLTADEETADSLRELRRPPAYLTGSLQAIGVGSDATPGTLDPGEGGRIPIYYVGQTWDENERNITFSLGSLTAADTTEKVAYVQAPFERLVYERPRNSRLDLDIRESVWPHRAVRASTGSNPVAPIESTSGGGGGGSSSTFIYLPPPNCFEEYLTIDWIGELRENARPDSMPPDAWESILYSIRTAWANDAIGPEWTADLWATYVEEMAENVNYLADLGQATSSVAAIWGLEVAEASAALSPVRYLAGAVDVAIPMPGLPLTFSRVYGSSLPSRFTAGPLGRGWTHNWDIVAEIADGAGNVTLRGPGGVDRFFRYDGYGEYEPAAGDYGELFRTAGAFVLVETDGTVWQFRTDGWLDYVQDTNGNRITLTYQDGRLSSLRQRNIQQGYVPEHIDREIHLEYGSYAAGQRIERVIDTMWSGDADDRATTLQYSPDGEYLLRVTAPGNRVTEYTYEPATSEFFYPISSIGYYYAPGLPSEDPRSQLPPSPSMWVDGPRSHALTSVTYPDGTHDYFNYDDRGRLTQTHKDGGAEQVIFGYRGEGEVTVTDASGRSTTLYFGLGGQLAQVRDGDGRIVSFDYDDDFQLAKLLGPGGERYRYAYDAFGNLTETRDALNRQTQFSYTTDFNQLDSFTDARGNGIDYEYDPATGNLTSIVYQDGTHEDFTYDPKGNVLTATNRRGQTITYTYNAYGQVASKDYDTTGGVVDYVYNYDTAGNLTEAIDATHDTPRTTLMTYDPDTDLLERIEYPDGKFFEFDYDGVGRRTWRSDQDGNVINYLYDPLGRLDRMTDGSGALIVDYDYDAAGRLSRKTLGNGVYTVYDYDAAGHVLHLVNYKPDGSVLSRFDYTYDVSGRRTSMTTLEGTYEYGYDALGQLTSVRYPDGRIVVYDYDAAGNRRQVIDDGVVTSYTTNGMNQYVTVGDAVYEYDLDGNLISKTEGDVTTRYEFDPDNRLGKVDEYGNGVDERPTDTWTYSYDAFGNRIGATHNGEATQYVIDPTGLGNVAAKYDATGNLIARYDHGYGLVSRIDVAGDPAYYTFQAIGHTSELTDASGAMLNSYAYDPWGESLAKTEVVTNPFEYVGEHGVMNEGNGLEFMRARYYAPQSGHFLHADPIGVVGGVNLYTFATNSPCLAVDPSGLIALNEYEMDATDARLWRLQRDQYNNRMDRELLARERREIWREGVLLIAEVGVHLALEAFWPWGSIIGGVWVTVDLWVHRHETLDYWMNVPDWPGLLGLTVVSSFFRSIDPNDKLAPSGYGDSGYIQSDTTLPYTVRFENLAEATGPARQIVVTDVLDADLDLDTFELTEIAFANQTISVAPGFDRYDALVPMTVSGMDILVEVQAALDHDTRELTFSLRAIDPATGWFPEDPLIGILYPNDETHRGEGSISYTVRPNAGLPSGTEVHNRASIVFDYNDPIETPLVLNTLDAGTPASSIDLLPGTIASLGFDVSWSGQDEPGGSGIAGYDVYVSDNGGPWTPWLIRTEDTHATFYALGEHTYAFYSVAIDNVGHREPAPGVPDAQTTIQFPTDPQVAQVDVQAEPLQDRAVIHVSFTEPMVILPVIADDSILDAVGLFDDSGVLMTLQADQFGYDEANHLLTLTVTSLAEGDYELLLAGGLLLDTAGSPLRGGDPTTPGDPGGLYRYAFHYSLNAPPVANAGGPYTVDQGQPLALDGTGSYDPDTAAGEAIVLYEWDLQADGSYEYTGPAPTIPWEDLAAFSLGITVTVQLRVTDTFGATDTATSSLTIYDNRPFAVFAASPNPVAPDQLITFDASASSHGRPDRDIVSYAWDFGDGSTASGMMVTHAFALFGSYTVTLTVTDDNDPPKTAAVSTVVYVNQGNVAPVADTGGPYDADLGQGLTLDGSASYDPNEAAGDSIVSYQWLVAGSIALAGASPALSAAQVDALRPARSRLS